MAAKKQPGTAVVSWKDELAKSAQMAVQQEKNSGGGTFFSLKGGILAFDGDELPHNKLIVVVLDSIIENTYYADEYDPDTPQAPTCYAFGRDEEEMEPFETVEEKQASKCSECEFNKWGSAEKGRGKACRNGRRLALIPAGVHNKDGSEYTIDLSANAIQKEQIGFMRLSPGNYSHYSKYVKSLAAIAQRPPWAMVTEISVRPDKNTQFKVSFDALAEVDEDMLEHVHKRHEEAKGTIEFGYSKVDEEQQAERKPAKKAAGRAAKGRKY